MNDSRTEKQRRRDAAYQFELQASRLGFSILRRLPNYQYRLHDRASERELDALVLSCTFDFYEYRLNRGNHRVDLLIVQEHDAVAPIPVVSMSDSREFAPGAHRASARLCIHHRNRLEKQIFVSQLLVGVKEAQETLAAMPGRSRRRYLALRDQYLRPRIGRPVGS